MFKLLLASALIVNLVFPGLEAPEKVNRLYDSLYQETEKSKKEKINSSSSWEIKVNPVPSKATATSHRPVAKASLAADLGSNQILLSEQENSRFPVASLNKLMTAYIVLKENGLEEIFVVPPLEKREGDSQAGLYPGEKVTVQNLLKGMLINSGSDAAQTLAVGNAGSQAKFVEKMNLEAKKLGLDNTYYANVVGWDSQNNYSSAKDLYTLSRILLNNDQFRQIISTKSTTIITASGRTLLLANTNLLLGESGFIGVKTGYTLGAGECLISLNSYGGHEILTVIIGSPDRFGETRKYLDWIKSVYSW